jgi:tetratricopeptide (TPR) repeat protein
MKNIFLGVFAAALLVSCGEGELLQKPYNSAIASEALNVPTDFNAAIIGGYSYMMKNGGATGYGQELLIDSEVCTDNVILCSAGRLTNRDGHRFTYNANSTHFDFYSAAYRPAYMANLVLSQLDKLPKDATRDGYEGEAYFLRAINHFQLLVNYSPIPTQPGYSDTALGIVYMLDNDPTLRPSRPTVKESYDMVLSDLNAAKDLIGTAVVAGRANKAAVYTLLSRVYLFKGEYANAISAANSAIALNPAVATRAQFYTSVSNGLWEDTNAAGVLFKVRIDQVDTTTPGVAFSQGLSSGTRSEYVVSKELYDLYSATDVRKLAYFKTSAFNGISYNHISKYDGRGSALKNLVDIKVLRIEEAYLNKAEAEYRLSGSGLAALDVVRAQRYSSFVSGNESGQALLDAILKERRLEFAFEMDRFYTLKRLGLGLNRQNTGDRADGTGTPSEVLVLSPTDYRWQFPIPQGLINLNPNLQQTAGY